jgi:putative restriction endonuclease
MALSDITRKEIEQAVAEFNKLGRAEFLKTYGFGTAESYFLVHNGSKFDSKAIVGVAHKFLPGEKQLKSGEFSGGLSTVVPLLKKLGFGIAAVAADGTASPEDVGTASSKKSRSRFGGEFPVRKPGINYWWVNQNQTWRHEIEGGYLWSPKRNQNGARNQFYENMRLVEPGDVVFSYFDQKIENFGIVQRTAISGQKPADFGLVGNYWNSDGWYAPVEWLKLPQAVRPKALIGQIRPHLPQKYSPLKSDGDGLQSVYLAAVPEEIASILLSQQGPQFVSEFPKLSRVTGDGASAIELLDTKLEEAIKNDTTIDSTERDAVVKARRGQGRYRKNLEQFETRCRVTGVTDPRLLRASHIKPWRSCANNHERLDGQNGLLLAPHIDHLFDKGYISFSDLGDLLVSSRIDRSQLNLLGIPSQLNAGVFSEAQREYLHFHRVEVFIL